MYHRIPPSLKLLKTDFFNLQPSHLLLLALAYSHSSTLLPTPLVLPWQRARLLSSLSSHIHSYLFSLFLRRFPLLAGWSRSIGSKQTKESNCPVRFPCHRNVTCTIPFLCFLTNATSSFSSSSIIFPPSNPQLIVFAPLRPSLFVRILKALGYIIVVFFFLLFLSNRYRKQMTCSVLLEPGARVSNTINHVQHFTEPSHFRSGSLSLET